jgi:hypothetical protein
MPRMSRTALGPTQLPIQWVPGALSLRVKLPGREADHSPPSSAEVKEWVEVYLHSPSTPSWCCAQSTGTTLPFTFHPTTPWRLIGEWRYSSTHSWTRHSMEVSCQPHARPFYPQGKSPWFPLDRRLGGPQSRSGRGGEGKNSQPPPGIEP